MPKMSEITGNWQGHNAISHCFEKISDLRKTLIYDFRSLGCLIVCHKYDVSFQVAM